MNSNELRNQTRNQIELVISRLDTAIRYGPEMESSMIAASEDALNLLRTALDYYKKEKDTLYKVYRVYKECYDRQKGNEAYAIDEACSLTESSVDYVLIAIRRYGNPTKEY